MYATLLYAPAGSGKSEWGQKMADTEYYTQYLTFSQINREKIREIYPEYWDTSSLEFQNKLVIVDEFPVESVTQIHSIMRSFRLVYDEISTFPNVIFLVQSSENPKNVPLNIVVLPFASYTQSPCPQ